MTKRAGSSNIMLQIVNLTRAVPRSFDQRAAARPYALTIIIIIIMIITIIVITTIIISLPSLHHYHHGKTTSLLTSVALPLVMNSTVPNTH